MQDTFHKGQPSDEPFARVTHWDRAIETNLAVPV